MVPLPIVERELRVAARKRGTYILRSLSVGIAGILCAWFVLAQDFQWQQSGVLLFRRVVWVTFWAALATGLFTTADCLSSEKRQGTLGLLFLTNLRAYEVVLGKLAATSLNAIYGLVAVLPVLALPILMGGVTPGDLLFAACLLGLTLFISLSVGMLVSALSNTEFEAVLGTFLALIGVCVIPDLLAVFWDWSFGRPLYPTSHLPIGKVLQMMNPYHLLMISFNPRMAPSGSLLLVTFTLYASIGMCCLSLAGWIVQHAFRDGFGGMTGTAEKVWRSIRPYFKSTPAAPAPRRSVSERFHRYRRELLNTNPMLWLVNREPLRIKYVWFILGVFSLVWLAGFAAAPRLWLDWETTAFFALFLNGSLKLLLAAESPRQLAEDRKSGSLELILSTPLSESDVLSGYGQAIQRQFAKPIILVVFCEFFLLLIGGIFQLKPNSAVAVSILASITLLVSDSVTLTTLGIWNGLRSQIPSRAAWKGIFWVLIFPWLVAYPIALWLQSQVRISYQYNGFAYYGSRPRFNNINVESLWWLWLIGMLVYNFILLKCARSRLSNSLRTLAAETYTGI